jgi:hypothetical protein
MTVEDSAKIILWISQRAAVHFLCRYFFYFQFIGAFFQQTADSFFQYGMNEAWIDFR